MVVEHYSTTLVLRWEVKFLKCDWDMLLLQLGRLVCRSESVCMEIDKHVRSHLHSFFPRHFVVPNFIAVNYRVATDTGRHRRLDFRLVGCRGKKGRKGRKKKMLHKIQNYFHAP